MSQTVHLEPTVLVLRAFESGKSYGDEYNCAGTVIIDGDTATLKGVHGKITRAGYSSLRRQLSQNYGIQRLVFERIRKDGSHHRVIDELTKLEDFSSLSAASIVDA